MWTMRSCGRTRVGLVRCPAGRLHVPEVSAASSIEEVIGAGGHPVMLDVRAPRHLAYVDLERYATLLIGPESGWARAGQVQATLGPRNLRANAVRS